MPIDDRPDLDRLTRSQLYAEAAAWGIEHAPDLPKYVWGSNGAIVGGMVALLESRGVNRANMKTVKWTTVFPSEQERAAAAHQGSATSEQHYPLKELHQSAREGVDSGAILQARLDRQQAKPEPSELERKLEAALKRIEELEASPRPKPGKLRRGTNRKWELYRSARERGLDAKPNMTIAELEQLLAQAPH
jgi:hypothetical protein